MRRKINALCCHPFRVCIGSTLSCTHFVLSRNRLSELFRMRHQVGLCVYVLELDLLVLFPGTFPTDFQFPIVPGVALFSSSERADFLLSTERRTEEMAVQPSLGLRMLETDDGTVFQRCPLVTRRAQRTTHDPIACAFGGLRVSGDAVLTTSCAIGHVFAVEAVLGGFVFELQHAPARHLSGSHVSARPLPSNPPSHRHVRSHAPWTLLRSHSRLWRSGNTPSPAPIRSPSSSRSRVLDAGGPLPCVLQAFLHRDLLGIIATSKGEISMGSGPRGKGIDISR